MSVKKVVFKCEKNLYNYDCPAVCPFKRPGYGCGLNKTKINSNVGDVITISVKGDKK